MRLDISHRWALVGSLVIALFAGACSGGGASAEPDADGLRVVATTTVFADLVEQVGGDVVTVTSLVPKGGEVHTFDPTPSDLRAVVDADLVVMNGLGLDEWLAAVVADSGTEAPIVELGEDLDGVTYLEGEAHEDGGDSGHVGEAVNPHLWLDVSLAARYVERIIDALVAADPASADVIEANGQAYLVRLTELHTWALDQLASIPAEDRVIVSFHEALPYFAAAYDLKIVGTVVDAPGQDPSAGEIAALVDVIRSSGARAVFGEVQFSPELVETVALEASVAVEADLYTDSLGDAPIDTYEGMIRWDVERVVSALGR